MVSLKLKGALTLLPPLEAIPEPAGPSATPNPPHPTAPSSPRRRAPPPPVELPPELPPPPRVCDHCGIAEAAPRARGKGGGKGGSKGATLDPIIECSVCCGNFHRSCAALSRRGEGGGEGVSGSKGAVKKGAKDNDVEGTAAALIEGAVAAATSASLPLVAREGETLVCRDCCVLIVSGSVAPDEKTVAVIGGGGSGLSPRRRKLCFGSMLTSVFHASSEWRRQQIEMPDGGAGGGSTNSTNGANSTNGSNGSAANANGNAQVCAYQ